MYKHVCKLTSLLLVLPIASVCSNVDQIEESTNNNTVHKHRQALEEKSSVVALQ
jgi:hypothetical protein